jgi:hypothetical protein
MENTNQKFDFHKMAETFTRPDLETMMSSPDNMKEAILCFLCHFKPSSALIVLNKC